jgi:hypothetical protein
MISPVYAPRVYAAIGRGDLELHVTCHCGWLTEAVDGAPLWHLLVLFARHLAEAHPIEDLALPIALGPVLAPAAAEGGPGRG